MKNKKNSTIKFLLIVIFFMFVGGLAGGLGSRISLGLKVYDLIEAFDAALVKNAMVIFLIVILGLSLGSWILFFSGKKKVEDQLARDDELIDDGLIAFASAINSTIIIIGMVLYLNFVRSVFSYDLEAEKFNLVTGVFFVSILCSVLHEKKVLDFLKTYNPNLYANTLDLKFNGKYLDSVDEREKFEIYKAGYKAYKLMFNLLFFFLLAGTIISFDTDGSGIFSLVIAVVLVAGIISYTLEALKK